MSLKASCKEVGDRYFPEIRDPQGFLSSFPNWKPLNLAFPGKVGLTDLDGIVERKGQFLIIEKKQKGAYVKPFSGQTRTLKALHALGCFTVVYLFGDETDPSAMAVIHPGSVFKIDPVECTYRDVIKTLETWWIFANGGI